VTPTDRIDWSQLWYPGPKRVFTDAELARAGGQRPSRTLVAVLLANIAIMAFGLLQAAPPEITARLSALLVGLAAAGLSQGLLLWKRPTRRGLMWHGLALLGLFWLFYLGFSLRMPDPTLRRWVVGLSAGGLFLLSLGFWFVVSFRAHQIESRLRELDERDRAIAMAHQLAAAQIQPHFLFNSLAALQHWVQAKDDRAAPLLEALTGFLRATLPLFDQRLLRLADEAEAAQRYLAVMQLRLGERLRYRVQIEPAAADVQMPPGVLLTLVENAVEHGVQPSLRGADVLVSARVDAHGMTLEVSDTGPGLPPGFDEGTGLGNSRTRLQQACGAQATLTLQAGPEGGCLARVQMPSPGPR
jgi:signal transduction histidine kinase